jgi:hypothetical protein
VTHAASWRGSDDWTIVLCLDGNLF